MKVVNKYLEIRIYPSKADFNDEGDKIVSRNKLDWHFGNSRFVYNKELDFINEFRQLL